MKLIFMGDIMFGRNNNSFTLNPFENIIQPYKFLNEPLFPKVQYKTSDKD